MLQYCEKQKKKVMFIHVVHAFPIDFWTDLKKKNATVWSHFNSWMFLFCYILVNGLSVFW